MVEIRPLGVEEMALAHSWAQAAGDNLVTEAQLDPSASPGTATPRELFGIWEVANGTGTETRLIGYAQLAPAPAAWRRAWEREVSVVIGSASDRGKGYGTAVVRQLQKWATSEEVLTLVARAYEDDIVSRKLLQAEGFEECGIEHVLEHGRTRHVIRAVWEDGDAG